MNKNRKWNKNRKEEDPNKAKAPRNNRRGGTRGNQPTREDTSTSENEAWWYGASAELLRDSCSIPFAFPTGDSQTHDAVEFDAHGCIPPYDNVPGIMTLLTVPSIGGSSRAEDPINVASQSIYSFVRHANSGSKNYDAPDLFLYILAMCDIYSAIIWCERLYGYALTYNQTNRYLPNDLIRQNGVDPKDLVNNLANFRFWMNVVINKVVSFAVPNSLTIFNRRTFLYSNVYSEGTVMKDQMYQFAPAGFYKFGLDADDKGQLIWKPIDFSNLLTTQDVMDLVDELIGAVWGSEDFGIMSGDILKAYGDNIIKIPPVPESYIIVPTFDPMVLTQMKNARLFNADPSNITQDNNGNLQQTISQHTYTSADTDVGGNSLSSADQTAMQALQQAMVDDYVAITVDTDNPTPDVVMEATRLIYGYDTYRGEMRVGSEFIKSVSMCHTPGFDLHYGQLEACKANTMEPGFRLLEVKNHFHYAPSMSMWTDTTGGKYKLQTFFDLDNFAVLDNYTLLKMNTAAIMNMYAVPSVGKVQKLSSTAK